MRSLAPGALLALSLVSACSSTYDEKIAASREEFYAGRLEAARASIRERLHEAGEDGSEVPLFLLEESLIELAAGNAAKAERNLRTVRDVFDELETAEASAFLGETASYFTDDRFTAYAGEDYEKILIRTFLAFASLLSGSQDVVPYSFQILEKQRDILEQVSPDGSGRKYKQDYKRVGVGAYLYGVVTEERDPTAGSEVKISYEKVRDWEPQFSQVEADIERAERGVHSQKGNGVVYVFAFVGKGPLKIEVEERDLARVTELTTQMARFIPAIRENFGPTLDLSPIRIPVVVPRGDNVIREVAVAVDGEGVGITETVTDVTATAVQQYGEIRDWVISKALLRRMVKKAITTAAKGAATMAVEKDRRKRTHDQDAAVAAIEIAGILVNTLWSALERADTRYWSLLPDQIQALRFEVPAGAHEISLTPVLDGSSGTERRLAVEVLVGKNTYVFGFLSSPGVGPPLLTSRPAHGGDAE